MPSDWNAKPYIAQGIWALVIGLGGLIAWGTYSTINAAVVASGYVEVDQRKQVVQHPDGGVVAEINVRNGDTIKAGETIILLDDAELRSEQNIIRHALFEVQANIDRLSAEAVEAAQITFRPALVADAKGEPDLHAILETQQTLFDTRRKTLSQTDDQLRERRAQSEASIVGLEKQLAANREQAELTKNNLKTFQDLLNKNLTERSQVLDLQKQLAQINGLTGETEAQIAATRNAIAGYEIERLKARSERQESAQEEIRNLQPREAELQEKLRAVETRLSRLNLTAPVDGVVYGMSVFTVGSVVPAGGEVAAIVPDNSPLIVSVQLAPTEIDRITVGQDAVLKFPAFNARTTPEVSGQVSLISADAITDEKTGQRYFAGEVEIDPAAFDLLGENEIIPGMPVEAFIQTGAQSPASYLLKPFTDYLDLAFREE
ncbi:HlyD family type I secretion periplasmic adaptor subunit [Aliiroseovarius zhejiangensis]|uniref:Membrane fusion protein (MFP) family protein n=1 Tax=Aliiroseovarius zhejiangensis TaxID=1632025 RepID=A0ABQ3ISW7_9RHOB|nr:HlyD family type I secretion periplasmic adaptor subunit [Aliiroseovarius zhejiangensis]GHE90701.1 HlyD family type I secretion periplasmic adaptor subunit [Aliiroseovarius zhejiangensis]